MPQMQQSKKTKQFLVLVTQNFSTEYAQFCDKCLKSQQKIAEEALESLFSSHRSLTDFVNVDTRLRDFSDCEAKSTKIAFRFDDNIKQKLDKYAADNGMSKGFIVRIALYLFMKNFEDVNYPTSQSNQENLKNHLTLCITYSMYEKLDNYVTQNNLQRKVLFSSVISDFLNSNPQIDMYVDSDKRYPEFKGYESKSRKTVVYLTDEDYNTLIKLSKKYDASKSFIVRIALSLFCKSQGL